jgi:CelD/BcsL family acetyltransferase involved in cellulose biosynthesis
MSESLNGSLERLDVTGIDALREEWRSLETRCGQSFFISWGWIGPWLELVLPRVEVFVFRARCSGATVALGLLSRYGCKRGKLLGVPVFALNEARTAALDMVIEYNDLLGLPDHIATCRTLMLQTLLKAPYAWSELQLSGVDPCWRLALQAVASDLYEHLPEQRSPWIANIEGLSDLDAVLGGLSRNRRSKIRQSIKHFESNYGPLRTSEPSSIEGALAAFDRMGDLHTARWNRAGLSGCWENAQWADFHRRLIVLGFERGEVQLLSVFAGDALLGSIYSLLWKDRVYMLQSGFSEPRSTVERPGYVAHCLAMVVNGSRRMKIYDFMVGDAEYKQSLADAGSPLDWARYRRRSFWNLSEDRLLAIYRRVKARAALLKNR